MRILRAPRISRKGGVGRRVPAGYSQAGPKEGCPVISPAAGEAVPWRYRIPRPPKSGPAGREDVSASLGFLGAVLFDAQLVHQLIKRRTADAEFDGGGRDLAVVLAQHVSDHLVLQSFAGLF